MNTVLITIGRVTMSVAALLIIFAGAFIGSRFGSDIAWLGMALGLVVAGCLFSVAAAIFDAQSSLRRLLAIAERNAVCPIAGKTIDTADSPTEVFHRRGFLS